MPMTLISARLAPLPPSRAFMSALPSALPPPNEYTYLCESDIGRANSLGTGSRGEGVGPASLASTPTAPDHDLRNPLKRHRLTPEHAGVKVSARPARRPTGRPRSPAWSGD